MILGVRYETYIKVKGKWKYLYRAVDSNGETLDGCVAKTKAAGGKVRERVCLVISMSKSSAFKWRHYEPEIILLCLRWYLAYPLSYRQVAEMVNERGFDIHHTTVFRWVQ